jgi:nucleoside-diphosphate-sugar epimerase
VKVLLLGGGIFLGRHLIDVLLERGHDVTTFTRGRRDIHRGGDVARIVGDRDGDLAALERGGWDAIIDTCGYVPRVVRRSVDRLRDAGRYAFISTVSVYDDGLPEPHEDNDVKPFHGIETETVDGETYGPLKAACEAVVREGFDGGALVVRPGLIVGPHDSSDRFTYWVERGARGGTLLAPAPADAFVQFVDVRDLAAFTVRALEDDRSGTVNVTGLPRKTTMGDVVGAVTEVGAGGAEVCWVDDAFLLRNEVEPWMGLPLWLPASLGLEGFSNTSVRRALGWGLTLRPLHETVADTLAWVRQLPAERERKAGLNPQREAELVAAWRAAT